jgi:hypothetical protein
MLKYYCNPEGLLLACIMTSLDKFSKGNFTYSMLVPGHFGSLSLWQPVILAACHFAKLPFYSFCQLANLTFH